jgi:hypothetical protein
MAQLPRKSSACVTLVLIGAAALSGCGDGPRRTPYASKEACVADWVDPKECQEEAATQADGTRSRTWWGPSTGSSWHYGGGGSHSYGGSSAGPSSSGHSISHGGFGSHGSSSS